MLDDGSNETFLNEEAAGVLGLKERYQTVTVNVLNNEVETFQSMPLNVSIESLDGEFSEDIKVKTCPKRVTGNYKVENWKQSKNRWTHLTKCDFAEPAQDGLVDLLIGVDNAELHYSRADVRGEEGDPIARLGPLRWTCIGSPEGKQWTGVRAHVSRTLFTREPNVNVDGVCCDIDRTLKRFWEIENCGIERHDTVIITEEENEVLKKLKESIRYTGNGYQVGVPWKDEKPLLPDNHYTALSRLHNTEQVEIEDRDRPYFRMLWRDLDSSREPEVYEFSRVVFGKNSAPMEAQFVAQENARRHQDVYPMAAETVLKSTYMDDSIDSVETVQDGIQLYKELDSLWGIAGMQARKWVSNSLEVVEATPEADRATELQISEGQEPVVKTLGISWNSTEDTFTILTANEPQPNIKKIK